MTLEPGTRQHSTSPDLSARTSQISKKWSALRSEDEALLKDKSFRRYASGVERALSLFDTALQEWADYISFLGRLLKSLQAHPSNVAIIPSKAAVARRLAQCLNPALPSGVHQKTLEVYNYIFSMIGKDSLSRDLSLYFPGLSSTLSFASLTVRAPFLTLLETHLLQLDPSALRPALKALILSLLPGLEEETSEDFERTLKLFDDFKLALRSEGKESLGQSGGDEYFWQCFFLASITSDSRRLGALAYLSRNLPKLGTPLQHGIVGLDMSDMSGSEPSAISDEITDIVTSPEPGLLLRCFAAGLADDQILIQRGFLDLLVTHLPLHARVLQNRVKQGDLELLLIAACGVVIRRDMSLNRRLWAWLLGPEQSSRSHGDGGIESPLSANTEPTSAIGSLRTRYFEEYGLHPLTRAIFKMIQRDHTNPAERAKPFKICLALMDRWEIGGLVVPEVFLPIASSVRRYQSQSNSRADLDEVLRSASVFFDGVESGLIWGEIIGLIAGAMGTGKAREVEKIDKLSLVRFILSHFNVREEEMLLVHAPTAALTLLAMIEDSRAISDTTISTPKRNVSEDVLTLAMNIAIDLVELIPERALDERPSTIQGFSHDQSMQKWDMDNNEVLEKVRTFYVRDQGNLDLSRAPFSSRTLCGLLVRRAGNITGQSLGLGVLASGSDVAIKTRLLVALLKKSPRTDSLDTKGLLSVHNKLLSSAQLQFSVFISTVNLVTTLFTHSYISPEDMSSLVDPLVRFAWSYLSASHPKYHVETVRCLWQLQTCLSLSNREIEAAICNLVAESDIAGRGAESGRSFVVLWTHTLQDYHDRRGSKSSFGGSNNLAKNTGVGTWEVMLGRPLFLLLDALHDEKTQLFMTVRGWLHSLVGADRLFYLFVAKFTGFYFLQSIKDENGGSDSSMLSQIGLEDDDLDLCLYYFEKLGNILRWSSDNTWALLTQTSISTDKSHPSLYSITGRDCEISLEEFFVHVCLRAVVGRHPGNMENMSRVSQLHRTALSVLHQILLKSNSLSVSELQLETSLIDQLQLSLDWPDPSIQVSLLEVILSALRLRVMAAAGRLSPTVEEFKRPVTQDTSHNLRPSLVTTDGKERLSNILQPPPSLVKCLQAGFSASSSRSVLDSWTNFLTECLPFYSGLIFQILIPLVETLCSQVALVFDNLQATFKEPEASAKEKSAPEATLIFLLNGLEQVLAHGHDRLLKDETKTPTVKTPDQPQGFFGNMVSGVFSSDTQHSRTMTANNRLTVLLSFQDAVRICFTIWSWGGRGLEVSSQDAESAASFNYTSLRMRNRARRLLEHLFAVEALECLETVIEIWQTSSKSTDDIKYTAVFNLLHVLDGSKPKHTIPAIFDAIYSRTNPTTLEASRKSTLTSSLADTDLVVFLVEYTRSLEDDTMDEIWTDCMTFLKDILANPFPHRQTLPGLLELTSILGEKVDNTNFGEQRRMRRELGDIFLRLLTATFTTRPIGFSESAMQSSTEKQSGLDEGSSPRSPNKSEDVVGILASIVPNFPVILVESDRVFNAVNTISTSVIGPAFRSKMFPDNVTKSFLVLLHQFTRLPNMQKVWKKDVGDAFNDSRFFSSPLVIVEDNWLPLLRQWVLSDKERMPELLSRISPPTTAGIVFGVGATSARFEADRRTQLNLRRIATIVLAGADDTFITELAVLEEKLVELLSATTTSSPSSTTRADIYMVLRALVLKISPIHLAFLWPTINAELYAAISSVVAADHSQTSETHNNFAVLQACKLLDTLLCVAPDDFQLHEWLFITDTIDAVYRAPNYLPVALIDELSEELGSVSHASSSYVEQIAATGASVDRTVRRPLLGPGGIDCEDVNLERKDELVGKILRPFFSQLSIFAFERTYEMGLIDLEFCRRDLIKDLLDENGVVKAL